MNEKLILGCLVLLLIQQTLALLSNFRADAVTIRVLQRNDRITSKALERSEKKSDELRKKIRQLEDFIAVIKDRELDPAFIVTVDGMKLLPRGWKKHFQDAWGINK